MGRGLIARGRLAAGAAVVAALLLTSCGGGPDSGDRDRGSSDAENGEKNGDTAPRSGKDAPPSRPVPRGDGSRVPDDFNGDGHRDLVLNDLVKPAEDSLGDDAGIGVVYGTAAPRTLDPAVRQTLSPRANGARVNGSLPAAFDAEAACDLDHDGFGDLVITTDPPYDGQGAPPVPLQLLFGGPEGLSGKAVVLRIPAKARFGDEWPDHPVCGDFDGDGKEDLAVTASRGQVSYLRGPFTRTGAPRGAEAPVPGGGPVLEAPAPAADVNGDGYDDLVHATRATATGTAGRGELLLGGPGGPVLPGGAYSFKAVRLPAAPALPQGRGEPVTQVLRAADFDGDKKQDLVTRTHRGETTDLIAVYVSTVAGAGAAAAAGADHPVLTFSTKIFQR